MVIYMDNITTIPFSENQLAMFQDNDSVKDDMIIDYHNSKYKGAAFFIYLYNCRFKNITIDNVYDDEIDDLCSAYIKSNRVINSFQINFYIIESILNKEPKFEYLIQMIITIIMFTFHEDNVIISDKDKKYDKIGYNIISLFNEPEIINIVNICDTMIKTDIQKDFLINCKSNLMQNMNIFSVLYLFYLK
nr:MAG TPA: hypothetical protein [Caudoviricetes sp.]